MLLIPKVSILSEQLEVLMTTNSCRVKQLITLVATTGPLLEYTLWFPMYTTLWFQMHTLTV